jgi:hypothetical protein
VNLDKQIIKEKLSDIILSGSAAVFSIGEHFVQLAAQGPDTLYSEAVSHHFHAGLNIGLEASFASLGYKLEEGGNYSKVYTVKSGEDIDKVTNEIEIIFRDYYHAGHTEPFEVTDVE